MEVSEEFYDVLSAYHGVSEGLQKTIWTGYAFKLNEQHLSKYLKTLNSLIKRS